MYASWERFANVRQALTAKTSANRRPFIPKLAVVLEPALDFRALHASLLK